MRSSREQEAEGFKRALSTLRFKMHLTHVIRITHTHTQKKQASSVTLLDPPQILPNTKRKIPLVSLVSYKPQKQWHHLPSASTNTASAPTPKR